MSTKEDHSGDWYFEQFLRCGRACCISRFRGVFLVCTGGVCGGRFTLGKQQNVAVYRGSTATRRRLTI